MMTPRILNEDYRDYDDLPMLIGEYVRCSLYKQGHIVLDDTGLTVCGRSVYFGWDAYHKYRRQMGDRHGADPGEWYMAVDTRKSSLCGPCKTGRPLAEARLQVAMRQVDMDRAASQRLSAEVEPVRNVNRTPMQQRLHDMKLNQRMTTIAHVMRTGGLAYTEVKDGRSD